MKKTVTTETFTKIETICDICKENETHLAFSELFSGLELLDQNTTEEDFEQVDICDSCLHHLFSRIIRESENPKKYLQSLKNTKIKERGNP